MNPFSTLINTSSPRHALFIDTKCCRGTPDSTNFPNTDMILTDIKMPEMNGPAPLDYLEKCRPSLITPNFSVWQNLKNLQLALTWKSFGSSKKAISFRASKNILNKLLLFTTASRERKRKIPKFIRQQMTTNREIDLQAELDQLQAEASFARKLSIKDCEMLSKRLATGAN